MIKIKKKFGQHFLRDKNIVHAAITKVEIDETTSVFEIGCGDGFLTREILETNIARLWVFEIDPEWADYVRSELGADKRLHVFTENILDVDFSRLKQHAPWTLLANLPYQVTFPILRLLQKNRHLIKEGVVMVQEEVAQKIVKKSGRGYGFISLFFQYYFDWKLLNKVPPEAFYPPPKVFSRLMYFKPKKEMVPIPDETKFWKFIKCCFRQPRRTLNNNLKQTHYDISKIPEDILVLRAQQMSMDDFLQLWDVLKNEGLN
ncbi:16S rRNA (adenine(1518)-N(6)/adenine(1519)-N(6))-dimethyltransferase RsmA [Candidatus Dependentiae bacterium]